MENELERRAKSQSESGAKAWKSLQKALESAKPSPRNDVDQGSRAWRKLAEEARDHLNKGESTQRLQELVENMDEAPAVIDQALSDLKCPLEAARDPQRATRRG
jgi:hypothetical protein